MFVVAICSWPSQSAITVMSLPASSSRIAAVCRLRGIPRNRHYVDGWVMWPAGVFPLLGLSPGPVPAT
jgi:hypothetical protein